MESILGINFSIDSAAVLLKDGRLAAAACQERFDRIKHSGAFPMDAIRFCLQQGGVTFDQVSKVAFSWNPAVHLAAPNRLRETIIRDHREYLDIVPARLLSLVDEAIPDQQMQQTIKLAGGGDLTVEYWDHHLCHAVGAFKASGFKEASILTADGYGEQTATMLAVGDDKGVRPIRTIDFPHSIGAVYAAVTSFLGFHPNCDEGKVMALAGMGNPERYEGIFETILQKTEDGYEVDLAYFRYYMKTPHRFSDQFVKAFGQPRRPGAAIEEHHYDLAAALQQAVNRVLLHLSEMLHAETGASHLCLAGGVALNCVAMGQVEQHSPFSEIFILPAAHDGGGGIGAAALSAGDLSKVNLAPFSDFLGPSPDPEETEIKLKEYGISYEKVEDGSLAAAEMITKGNVVGYMNGRMEFGPRALGARSILADPRELRFKEIVNAKVKHREAFRPFAPVALEDRISDYLIDAKPTPFMNKAYMAKPEAAEKIPAVVHSDRSVRLQTVNADQNKDIFRLLSHFDSMTSVPMVMNTSLNKQGQPICNSIEDALSCLYTSGMDALILGNLLIRK